MGQVAPGVRRGTAAALLPVGTATLVARSGQVPYIGSQPPAPGVA
jgi:hypothetical protein